MPIHNTKAARLATARVKGSLWLDTYYDDEHVGTITRTKKHVVPNREGDMDEEIEAMVLARPRAVPIFDRRALLAYMKDLVAQRARYDRAHPHRSGAKDDWDERVSSGAFRLGTNGEKNRFYTAKYVIPALEKLDAPAVAMFEVALGDDRYHLVFRQPDGELAYVTGFGSARVGGAPHAPVLVERPVIVPPRRKRRA
jgi:hypothetical protein